MACGPPMQQHDRLAPGFMANLDIHPFDAPRPTGSEGLERSLLGSPPSGVMLGGSLKDGALVILGMVNMLELTEPEQST